MKLSKVGMMILFNLIKSFVARKGYFFESIRFVTDSGKAKSVLGGGGENQILKPLLEHLNLIGCIQIPLDYDKYKV